MSETVAQAPGRPRRWWLTLILNVVIPPTGYAYVGAWRWVLAAVIAIGLGPLVLFALSATWPPGLFVMGPVGQLSVGAALALSLGVHGAWLASRAPARTGDSRALLYITPWIGLFVLGMVLRAYGPFATYAVVGASMVPGLSAGDTILADQPRADCGETQARVGDVVLHRRDGQIFPLRAVAGPGQIVSMANGVLTVDGRSVLRRPLGSEPSPSLPLRATLIEESLPGVQAWRVHDLDTGGSGLDAIAPLRVPAGMWYLLGDNRDNVVDSRTHGPVRTQDICAVATKILSSKDPARVGLKP